MKKNLSRYYGSKFFMLDWLQTLFPKPSKYVNHMVDVFGGGGVVSLNTIFKINTYNDINNEMVNLFKEIRDNPDELCRLVYFTPYAREELKAASLSVEGLSNTEKARRTILKLNFARNGTLSGGSFSNVIESPVPKGTQSWKNLPEKILRVAERIKDIQIENLPFEKIIDLYDKANVFFYLDPPYLPETRASKKDYVYEMTIEDHILLLERIITCKAKVAISGYNSELYNRYLSEWNKYEESFVLKSNNTKLNNPEYKRQDRKECLWTNYKQDNDTLFQ